jgi:hypothetical protein
MTRIDMDDRTLLGRAEPRPVTQPVVSTHGSVISRVNRLLATLIFGAVMFLAGVLCTASGLPGVTS